MKEMTIKEIVADWLKEHGCDGLCSREPCGCSQDDLLSCGSLYDDCLAAVKGPTPPEYEGEVDWLVPKQFPVEGEGEAND